MKQEKILARSVRLLCSSAALVGMGSLSGLAQAQEAAAPVEVVQVTGSRILSPGVVSNSPIYTVKADELRSNMPIAVEDFIKNLPSASPAVGPGTNNGSGGGATIDLRGLGANRTLVLVNGRRLVPFDLSGRVDTNSIPIALLSSVDLLTGGASVVYGADAISGVVNFNLKRNFTGVDLSTTYGKSGDGDTMRRKTDLTLGANLADGRGNVTMSIGKTVSDPLTQGERKYSVTSLNSVNGAPTGSTTGLPAIISVAKPAAGGADNLAGNWQINPSTGALVSPAVPYNTNPPNYFQTGLDRTQFTGMGNFKINDHAEVYSDVFYTNSKVASTLAASGTFGNVYQVPIGNPYLPEAARQQICTRRGIPAASCVVGNATLVPIAIGRRFTELGPRFNNFDNKTMQFTLGVKGDVAYDWTYDASFTRGTADQTQVRQNWGSLSKVSQALNALNTTTCVNNTNGCVPLNVFGVEGSITPEMLKFVNQSAILQQSVRQDVAAVSFSGDLGKLQSPWANTPISMAVGGEQRKVIASTMSDAASQIQGEVLGTGSPTPDRTGSLKLKEFSLESIIPLVRDKTFVRQLNMEVGYRHTDFSTDANKTSYGSYKYGGDWEPVRAVRLRGMMQKATRAPNIDELFSPTVTGLSNLSVDPCQLARVNAGQANTAGTLSNLCRLTGVPTSAIGSLPSPSSSQVNIQTGGNPNLGPEEAKTKTLGFVVEPLPRLAISVDYYKIDIDKAVSSPTITDVLDGCYSTVYNPGLVYTASCALVQRSTANGTFNGVEAAGVVLAQSNLGKQMTKGYDVNMAYKLPLSNLGLSPDFGSLDLGLNVNFVTAYTFQAAPTSVNRNCRGFYSVACGAPNYKNKFNQRATWNIQQFAVGYNWRHVGKVIEEPGGTVYLPQYSKIPAYNYVDFNGTWNISKNFRVNLALNNAFDKQPPIVGGSIGGTSTNGGNTFPTAYDVIGRYITFGATMKF